MIISYLLGTRCDDLLPVRYSSWWPLTCLRRNLKTSDLFETVPDNLKKGITLSRLSIILDFLRVFLSCSKLSENIFYLIKTFWEYHLPVQDFLIASLSCSRLSKSIFYLFKTFWEYLLPLQFFLTVSVTCFTHLLTTCYLVKTLPDNLSWIRDQDAADRRGARPHGWLGRRRRSPGLWVPSDRTEGWQQPLPQSLHHSVTPSSLNSHCSVIDCSSYTASPSTARGQESGLRKALIRSSRIIRNNLFEA